MGVNILKKVLRSLLRLLGNAKIADLNNDGKIETLREEVAGVFSQFKEMKDTLTKVNNELDEVITEEVTLQEIEQEILDSLIEEANKKKAESAHRVEKALQEIKANKKLQEKVSEFII